MSTHRESGGSPQEKVEFSKEELVKQSYQQLLSDRKIIHVMCKGNEEMTETVIYKVTEQLLDEGKKIDMGEFLRNSSYRNSIYKRKMIDVLRRKPPEQVAHIDDRAVFLPSEEKPLDKLISSHMDLEKYIAQVFASIDEVYTKPEKVKKVIKLLLDGYNQTEIAHEMNYTQANINRMTKVLEKKLPMYTALFDYIKDNKEQFISIRKKETLNRQKREADRATLVMLTKELEEKRKEDGLLSEDEEKILVIIRAYIQYNFDINKVIEKLKEEGLESHPYDIKYMKRKINQMAGREISYRSLGSVKGSKTRNKKK